MKLSAVLAASALSATIGAAILSLAGCGGAGPPTAAHTDAMAALRSAEQVGAGGEPQAAYHVELAREQIVEAEALIDRGRMADANGALMRAKADADLAIALTREGQTREDAEDVRDRIELLERTQEQ